MAVLASDGLWDTHTNEEAVALVSKVRNQEVVLIMVEVVTRLILTVYVHGIDAGAQ